MTLQEAIEILDEYERLGAECTHPDLPDALNLGKEALKAWQRLREGRAGVYDAVLPGETKD